MFASGGLPHLSSNLGSYQGCLNNKFPTSEKCWDIILNENLIRKSQIPYTNNSREVIRHSLNKYLLDFENHNE